ncbi:MAG TPA: Hpt domain-containing protein [Burkholderiales bacterium]|jgi:two-component system sensor histidine kinase EvgS|nr:Hpt domain-containing protein [Burkholderiales bacterium]
MIQDEGERQSQPLDRAVLAEMCGGDEAFERRILRNFWQATQNDIAKLRDAVISGDLRAVALISHSIKGASRTIGAHELAAVCDRIEEAGRAAESSTILATMPAFDCEVERVFSYLESLLGVDHPASAARSRGNH